jgi:Domain of unknown function (DUF4136)
MRTMKTPLFCALMLTASLAIAHHVRTDYDRSAEFYRYKTFMWINEPQSANPLMNEWIVNAVNAELEARGLCLVTSNADLGVSANTATCGNEIFYAGLAGGWSWYYYWRPKPSITVIETFDAETLVVDLFDTQKRRVVWWATGTETVSEKAEKNVKHLNKAVERMFQDFPPFLHQEVRISPAESDNLLNISYVSPNAHEPTNGGAGEGTLIRRQSKSSGYR